MKTYDVAIVGGGPSGCAAGYDLAAAGLHVLILDKSRFPRFKPCAGAITIKTLNLFRYSIAPVIKIVVYNKIAKVGPYREIFFHSNHPVCVTTIRSQLDAFCLKKTLKQGADFKIIEGVKEINENSDSVSLIDYSGRVYRARYLIGADGAHSKVRKITGEFIPEHTAMAIEGIIPLGGYASKPELTFDYGVIKNGYGWLIPKHNHINVGLYTNNRAKTNITKAQLVDYITKKIGKKNIENLAGFPIGTGGESYIPKRSRIFLVGDAAGFAEPLWGEGLHNAIRSGQAAAMAVALAIKSGADANEAYKIAIYDLKKDIKNCIKLSRLFYKLLPLSYVLLKMQPIRTAVLKGFAAGMTVTEIKQALFSRNFNYKIKKDHSLIEWDAMNSSI